MNNIKTLLFELAEDTVYSANKIVAEIANKYPKIGDAVVFPINMENESHNVPIFIFKRNKGLQMSGNFYQMVFTVNDSSDYNVKEIISFMFDIFNKYDLKTVGVACIYDNILDNDKIKEFKKRNFLKLGLADDEQFHFNVVKIIDINGTETRCLEGYSTLNTNFVSHFEFNMKKRVNSYLSLEGAISFFEETLKFKEEKVKCTLD